MMSPSGRCLYQGSGLEMGNSTRFSLSWSGTHLWCHWRHQTFCCPFRTEEKLTFSWLLPVFTVRTLRTRWRCKLANESFSEAGIVSLLSLNWWIALCACRGTQELFLSWVDRYSISEPDLCSYHILMCCVTVGNCWQSGDSHRQWLC